MRTLAALRVYYKIPGDDNEMADKLIGMLYENFKLRVELALAPIEKLTRVSKGIIVIERLANSMEIRYEGFTPELELICRWLIAQMADKQKIKY